MRAKGYKPYHERFAGFNLQSLKDRCPMVEVMVGERGLEGRQHNCVVLKIDGSVTSFSVKKFIAEYDKAKAANLL